MPGRLTHAVSIQTSSVELEMVNNNQAVTTRVPYHVVCLPELSR
jgi:hypothetical protein